MYKFRYKITIINFLSCANLHMLEKLFQKTTTWVLFCRSSWSNTVFSNPTSKSKGKICKYFLGSAKKMQIYKKINWVGNWNNKELMNMKQQRDILGVGEKINTRIRIRRTSFWMKLEGERGNMLLFF